MTEINLNDKEKLQEWFDKIAAAEKNYAPYHQLIKTIRQYYRGDIKKDKQNIFWSSIETLKPFLYFKQPVPFIDRKSKTADKAANLACQILEKALQWDLEQFDFDSIIKYARNDFLLSGMGVAIERYKPTFAIIKDEQGQDIKIKIAEQVNTEYLDPLNFIADSQKVGIWEDCTWFAIRHYVSLLNNSVQKLQPIVLIRRHKPIKLWRFLKFGIKARKK